MQFLAFFRAVFHPRAATQIHNDTLRAGQEQAVTHTPWILFV